MIDKVKAAMGRPLRFKKAGAGAVQYSYLLSPHSYLREKG